MWELDCTESWAPKNWCFWTMVLQKTLESPVDCKEIQPVHPKGNQSWIFIGRTDAEAHTLILWPPDAKNWPTRKDSDAGENWRQEEKGTTEDEMVGWHHRLNGHEFEQAPGVGDGQGGLACCSPWGGKEPDTIKWLNWTRCQPCAKAFHICYFTKPSQQLSNKIHHLCLRVYMCTGWHQLKYLFAWKKKCWEHTHPVINSGLLR